MQQVTLKCPKCGYSQEERQDCVRCGIVFAKYYAMYPQGRDMPAEGQDAALFSSPASGDTLSVEISDLRQGVREIANRLTDVEFDRAERGLLRGDVKSVEQKVAELEEDLRSRLLALENRASDPAQTPQAASAEALDCLARRVGLIEQQLEGLATLARSQDPRTEGMIGEIATRQGRLEDRLAQLVSGIQTGEESGLSAKKELGELRQAVQKATVRYTEIGDLKKNHLVLQNEIETLRRDQEILRQQPANGTLAKIAQLESEAGALRAEARQMLKRLESIEADFSTRLQEARAAASAGPESAEVGSSISRLDAHMTRQQAALEKQNEIFTSELLRIEGWNQSMTTGLQETSDGLKEACRRIDGFASDVDVLKQESTQLRAQLQAFQNRVPGPGPAADAKPQSAAEGDLHAIKEGLDQIRVFMQTLSQKL